MAEIETKPGVFISVVTLERWKARTAILEGADLAYFVNKCTPATMATDRLKEIIGVNKQVLYHLCADLEPDFNPETDYFTIRYSP